MTAMMTGIFSIGDGSVETGIGPDTEAKTTARGCSMDIPKILMDQVRAIGPEVVLKRMGYRALGKPLQRLDSFAANNLLDWLLGGGFDFRYTNEQFVAALIQAAELPAALQESVEATFSASVQRKNDLEKMDQPYIFIDTGFRRKSEDVITLVGMQGLLRITIAKKDVLGDPREELARVCALVRRHYEEKQGKLDLWGTIQSYVYYPDAHTRIIISPDGVVSPPDTPVCESMAFIRIG